MDSRAWIPSGRPRRRYGLDCARTVTALSGSGWGGPGRARDASGYLIGATSSPGQTSARARSSGARLAGLAGSHTPPFNGLCCRLVSYATSSRRALIYSHNLPTIHACHTLAARTPATPTEVVNIPADDRSRRLAALRFTSCDSRARSTPQERTLSAGYGNPTPTRHPLTKPAKQPPGLTS